MKKLTVCIHKVTCTEQIWSIGIYRSASKAQREYFDWHSGVPSQI